MISERVWITAGSEDAQDRAELVLDTGYGSASIEAK